jgi:hypothetical protein
VLGIVDPEVSGAGNSSSSLELITPTETIASMASCIATVFAWSCIGVTAPLNINSSHLTGISPAITMDVPLRFGVIPGTHFDVGPSLLGLGGKCSHPQGDSGDTREGAGNDLLLLNLHGEKKCGQDARRHLFVNTPEGIFTVDTLWRLLIYQLRYTKRHQRELLPYKILCQHLFTCKGTYIMIRINILIISYNPTISQTNCFVKRC